MTHEIVAFLLGGSKITNNIHTVRAAMDLGLEWEPLDRCRMQFMADFDLGPRWTQLARAPTLFCITDDDKLTLANGTPYHWEDETK